MGKVRVQRCDVQVFPPRVTLSSCQDTPRPSATDCNHACASFCPQAILVWGAIGYGMSQLVFGHRYKNSCVWA